MSSSLAVFWHYIGIAVESRMLYELACKHLNQRTARIRMAGFRIAPSWAHCTIKWLLSDAESLKAVGVSLLFTIENNAPFEYIMIFSQTVEVNL